MILTDEKIQKLTLSLLYSRADQGAKEAEIRQVLEWAAQAELDYGMLTNVYEDDARVNIVRGEIVFSLTPKGIEAAEKMIREEGGKI